MANQYYISNLSAKIDHMSMKDNTNFTYERKEKDVVIEKEPTISMVAAHLENDNEQIPFSTNKHVDEMNHFLNTVMVKISELKLTKIATNTIFRIYCEFVEKLHTFNCDSITQHQDDDIMNVLVGTKNLVLNKLHEFDSQYKRQKIVESSNDHLKSREICIGTRLKMQNDKKNNVKLPKQIRPTFQYFPILNTLQTIFSLQHVKKLYFDYNLSKKHQCVPGVYADFCCGQKYTENRLFTEFPESLQLQLFVDAFEVCDGLKSKAGRHSQIAVYLAIRNMPTELSYNMENIFLVAFCNSAHMKSDEVDYNNIWQAIVDDIRLLEDIGIYLDDGRTLKGTIVNVTFDNLGGNSSLGFVESFAAHYFCRICTLIKDETKQMTREDTNKFRTRNSYDEIIKQILSGENLDYQESLGLKRMCYLNNLKYFHILDNFNLDIFHDLMEGTVPLLLKLFFEFGINHKVFTEKELVNAFQYFDYGPLNKLCIPSAINLTRRNLGQNASQTRCILLNMPFVLYLYKQHEDLMNVWKCIASMQKIVRIVYSPVIDHDHFNLLKEIITEHLEDFKICFEVDLTPKQHNMTHMPTAISMAGPLVHMSTLRFEGKHKEFSSVVKKMPNFKNVSKSLAQSYEMKNFDNCYLDQIKIGRKLRLKPDEIVEDLFSNFDLNKLFELKSLKFNSHYYEKGLFLKENDFFYRIEKVLFHESEYFFLCKQYTGISFDEFLNSVNIKENIPTVQMLLCLSQMSYKKSHSDRKIGNSLYIISESTEIKV